MVNKVYDTPGQFMGIRTPLADQIDQFAHDAGLQRYAGKPNRSQAIHALLTFALAHTDEVLAGLEQQPPAPEPVAGPPEFDYDARLPHIVIGDYGPENPDDAVILHLETCSASPSQGRRESGWTRYAGPDTLRKIAEFEFPPAEGENTGEASAASVAALAEILTVHECLLPHLQLVIRPAAS